MKVIYKRPVAYLSAHKTMLPGLRFYYLEKKVKLTGGFLTSEELNFFSLFTCSTTSRSFVFLKQTSLEIGMSDCQGLLELDRVDSVGSPARNIPNSYSVIVAGEVPLFHCWSRERKVDGWLDNKIGPPIIINP